MNGLERAIMTISCQDCADIPKVGEAGRILQTSDGTVQLMHNGLKVKAGGYHGDWMAHIIRALRGHHEPQEELAFHHLLKYVRNGSLIVELGAFWSYYSLWFVQEIPGSSAVCIEPDPGNLAVGQHNARLNGMEPVVRFHQACVGGTFQDNVEILCESDGAVRSIPCFDMKAVSALAGGTPIEVLHMDVQGQELPFIQSMREAAGRRQVRFVVASTHHSSISGSMSTHEDCCDALIALGATILCQHSVQESYSGDGLIVASFYEEDRRISLPDISRNEPRLSLFPDR